jgi:hypothetical protein
MSRPTMAPSPPGTETSVDSRRGAMAVTAAVLALLSLVLHLTLAWQLDHLGVFEKKNMLFDADTETRLRAISAGKHLGIKHPNLMPYFTPPITLAARALAQLCPGCGTEPELQRTLGVMLVPVASALKTMLVFYLFCRLGFSSLQAALATLLSLVSFSTLIFGSIPESYGLTALAMAIAYFAAASAAELTWRRIILWIAIGVFATGITLTNVVLVALLLWAASSERRLVAGGIRVAAIALVIFGVTGASAYVLDLALVEHEPSAGGGASSRSIVLDRVVKPIQKQFVTYHDVGDSGRKLRHFPTAMANAFAPPRVATVSIDSHGPQSVGFSLEHSPSIFGLGDPLGLSVVILIVAGAVCSLAAPRSRRIAVASIGIIAIGWLLGVWGSETHLFSQHWHLPSVVLIAGVMTVRKYGALMTAVLAVLTFAIAVNNLMVVRGMLALLSGPAI